MKNKMKYRYVVKLIGVFMIMGYLINCNAALSASTNTEDLGFQDLITTSETHKGLFLNSSGNPTSSVANYTYTDPLPVKAGVSYVFAGYGTHLMSAIVSCDSEGNNRISEYKYTDSEGIQTFTYIPRNDGYIMVSFQYDKSSSLFYEPIQSAIEDSAVDRVAREMIETVTEEKPNLFKKDEIIIGEDWTGGKNPRRASIYIDVEPGKTYSIVLPDNAYISYADCLQMKRKTRSGIITSDSLIMGTSNIIEADETARCFLLQFSSNDVDFTQSMFNELNIVVTCGGGIVTAVDEVARDDLSTINFWRGKKLVWLGTSIPAAGKYNPYNLYSYPLMVGELLDCTVYNEAVGSSALHCKSPDLISESNPYGFLPNFEAVSRCLTNSLSEMDWIIDHFNDEAVFTQNVPSSLSDDDKEFIRSCSWEIKLKKYFTDENFPDAWIIDHGHNDLPTAFSERTYDARTALSGTVVSGWYYKEGELYQSDDSSYIEFDVENINEVWISGSISENHDLYDLFNVTGENIKHYFQDTNETVKYTNMFVDTRNATKLCISNSTVMVKQIYVMKYTYGSMYNSLYSFQGGMDFIINKIKEYNPRAKIILIGEYENQKYPSIAEYQKKVADRWCFPFYEQWKYLGWSQMLVDINGEYVTYLNAFIPDNLHPHTDTTGWALKQMASGIATWLMTIR